MSTAYQFTPEQQAAIEAARARKAQQSFTPEQQAAIEAARARKSGQTMQPAIDPNRPRVTGGRGIAAQQANQAEYDENQRIEQFRQQSKAQGLPFVRDLEEIGNAPELNMPNMSALKASFAANFTFDDAELGRILEKQVGAKIGQDAEGNYFAQMPSGQAYAINNPGFSAQDVAKLASNVALFTPASRVAGAVGQGVAGVATQGVIEGTQAALGGEVNPGDMAVAGAAPIVAAGVGKGLRRFARQGRSPAAVQAIESRVAGESDQIKPQIADSTIDFETMAPPKAPEVTARVNAPVSESMKRQEIRQSIKNGTKEAAEWKLDRTGKIIPDPVAKVAVKNGFKPETVATVKFGTAEDRQAMLQMLDIAEAGMKSGTARARMRPQRVIGDTIMKRLNVVAAERKAASAQIRKALETDLKGVMVDVSDIVDNFYDDMMALGATVDDAGNLSFRGTPLAGSNIGPVKKIAEMPTQIEAKMLHQYKRNISGDIQWSKNPLQAKTINDEVEKAVKKFRSAINDRLGELSEGYKAGNERFSKAIDAINDFSDVMGKRFDPESDRVADLVGQEMRKVLSNYSVRNDMIEAIDKLDEMARSLGGKFSDDPIHQTVFYSDLEKLLGSFADNSLQGVQEKAIGVALDAATGGPTGTAINALRSGFKSMSQPDKEKAIKAMRAILKGQSIQ